MFRIRLLLPAPFLLSLLFGCSEEKEKQNAAPATQLQLHLTDQAGNPLTGVPVALYRNQEDWLAEQNPVQVATTTPNGVANFIYLVADEYYVNARTGSLSNWEGNIFLTGIQPGAQNLFSLTLRPYRSSQLAAAGGKVWQVIRYKENGIDLTEDSTRKCITDDNWRFYKGATIGNFQLNEGATKCNPTDDQIRSSTWHFVGNQTLLFTKNQQTESYTIDFLSETTLRIQTTSGGTTYAYTLQSF